MLDKQITILSVDTCNFYSNREARLHWKNHKLRIERFTLVQQIDEIENELQKYGIDNKELSSTLEEEGYNLDKWIEHEDYENIKTLCEKHYELKKYVKLKNTKIKQIKNIMLALLANKVDMNIKTSGKHHVRKLRNLNPSCNKKNDVFKNIDVPIDEDNCISVFDSSFTRMIHANQESLCEDFMVIQVYYFDVVKDLIYHGFIYKGEKYRYFTSSAGQIRTKKCVFVKESVWNKYEKTIMCGLTLDKINSKGGSNPNKFLAYTALTNSATDAWEDFDIDKTIVVPDFETNVNGEVDFIDDVTYKIERNRMDVPIPHMDGCGIILPSVVESNRMIRLPWVKGLLGQFDFRKFIEVHNCSPIVTDIYGKEHDVIKEDIQIIFTASQFKMHKYYESWEEYKDCFKRFNCVAGYTNPEREKIKDSTINYQMLQSLTDITEDEMYEIAKPSIDKLNNLCSSVDNIKILLGITDYNQNQTYFQKAISLYPDLINDVSVKDKIRDIKDALTKRYKSGKLSVHGKYTFLLPDLYAFAEWLFLKEENPKGLLENGEVFCWLFKTNDKLDCLRSPHLYIEHAIRNNVACGKYGGDRKKSAREWFCSNAVYTSCHDLISKILQFDVDGDTSLVVADKAIIKVAERNIKNVVPLFYNMKKAPSVILTKESIYDGLNHAFTGSNIGIYSNDISKIYNSDIMVNGTDEEKRKAIDLIKILCCENNFKIDYAKTLYMPERPDDIHEDITSFTNNKLPAFFKYAKDKLDEQVELPNGSFVNRLDDIIPKVRLNFRHIGLNKPDYTLLMTDPDVKCQAEFTDKGKIIKEKTDPMILKYIELNSIVCYKINNLKDYHEAELINNSKLRELVMFNKIKDETLSELSKFGYTKTQIVDMLIDFSYRVKNNTRKDLLWICYGNIIYQNLKRHIHGGIKTKVTQCEDCGKWFEIKSRNGNSKKCPDCYEAYRKQRKLETQRLRRMKMKSEVQKSDMTLN